jgi:hypothetical protein
VVGALASPPRHRKREYREEDQTACQFIAHASLATHLRRLKAARASRQRRRGTSIRFAGIAGVTWSAIFNESRESRRFCCEADAVPLESKFDTIGTEP